MMEVDRAARHSNEERLTHLSVEKAAGVKILCARDPVEFERAAAVRMLSRPRRKRFDRSPEATPFAMIVTPDLIRLHLVSRTEAKK